MAAGRWNDFSQAAKKETTTEFQEREMKTGHDGGDAGFLTRSGILSYAFSSSNMGLAPAR